MTILCMNKVYISYIFVYMLHDELEHIIHVEISLYVVPAILGLVNMTHR